MVAVRYLVTDVDTAGEFCTRQLGFALEQRGGLPLPDPRAWGLAPLAERPGETRRRALSDGRQPSSASWNRLLVEVENLASAGRVPQGRRGRVRGDIVPGPRGKQVLGDDLSGNPVELFESA